MDFGWIPPDQRTQEQSELHDNIVTGMPNFALVNSNTRANVEKSVLWDFSKKANNGEHFLAFWQQTGSCVGNGGGQLVWYLSAVECFRLNDPGKVVIPFYLLPYGRSRLYAGFPGRGEGSTGAGFAKAIHIDGILPYDHPNLPQPSINNSGITWGKQVELQWSDGRAIDSQYLEASKLHLVQSVAKIKSLDQARDSLQNYYGFTIASDWGGLDQCEVKGSPPVLLSRHVQTWRHQMCVIGWWDHPTLKSIWYVLNSWGPKYHGIDPSGGPPGGFWIQDKNMQYILNNGEAYAFSQFDDFYAQDLSYYI